MAKSEYVRQRVDITLSVEVIELLAELAQTLGLSRSGTVELAVRKLWEREGAPLAKKLRQRRRS